MVSDEHAQMVATEWSLRRHHPGAEFAVCITGLAHTALTDDM